MGRVERSHEECMSLYQTLLQMVWQSLGKMEGIEYCQKETRKALHVLSKVTKPVSGNCQLLNWNSSQNLIFHIYHQLAVIEGLLWDHHCLSPTVYRYSNPHYLSSVKTHKFIVNTVTAVQPLTEWGCTGTTKTSLKLSTPYAPITGLVQDLWYPSQNWVTLEQLLICIPQPYWSSYSFVFQLYLSSYSFIPPSHTWAATHLYSLYLSSCSFTLHSHTWAATHLYSTAVLEQLLICIPQSYWSSYSFVLLTLVCTLYRVL